MNTKHTPGPWSPACKCNSEAHRLPAILSDGRQVAIATFRGSEPETDANARLIAAAPELLNALQALADEYGPQTGRMAVDSPRREMWFKARAAIAKATGSAA